MHEKYPLVAPITSHGYPVLHAATLLDDGREVILAENTLRHEAVGHTEYIVWYREPLNGYYYAGTYTLQEEYAERCFAERIYGCS